MIDYDTMRARLNAKIKAIGVAKQPPRPAEGVCEHVWKKYRLTVHSHRDSASQPPFKGRGAYFVLLGCSKCKYKKFIDYVVER